jgi:rhodanese-related sulfurtransferase
MAPFPIVLTDLLGKFGAYIIYLVIGFLFGYALEIAGFGKSTKLAAQFYFKDLTVLKVMFTAIIVAMVLIFGASAVGLLDYNLVWVNPTYLWPGILGGFIMGIGFILGGFCPGTSLVALATFKIDGLFFALGVLFGIFIFGETVDTYKYFWNSSYLGRFTLMEFLNLDTGWVVLLVVLMALFMFWGGEQLEKIFGGKDPKDAPRERYFGAGGLVLAAVGVLLIGQPTNADRWAKISIEKSAQLKERVYQIHPGELLHTMHDHKLNLVMLDVREEGDYNLFHLLDADHVLPEDIPDMIEDFHMEPANTVFVVMSNDETRATEVWKYMVAEAVPNVYILDGGINYWLDIFHTGFEDEFCGQAREAADDELRYEFEAALGAGCPAAFPNPDHYEDLEYIPRIQLELKRAPTAGGCG